MFFSIIVPVYNRPEEILELLESIAKFTFDEAFEVVIVEDGSTLNCKDVVEKFKNQLQISYFFKQNSGPGDSRNFGMSKAKGDYFIIFDSDCIIPSDYLTNVSNLLKTNYVDCFGGPDKALSTFSNVQKAINFAMTSFLTTGGIRGGSEKLNKFQPRSFNMGISKKAFIASKGFGLIHPGEDPDLAMRLWKLGFETRLFKDCAVFHKRRIDWNKFSVQVSKFGKARPILNSWYPEYSKLTFWFPAVFIAGFLISIGFLLLHFYFPFGLYLVYFLLIFLTSTIESKSVLIGLYSVKAVFIQFSGYGSGFLKSFVLISILNKKPELAFPELFFKKQSRTKIIGLTGGIGSGKTTVAIMFQDFGIPVYYSDIEAKKIMEQPEIIKKIVAEFGSELLDANAMLQRKKLAALVFSNPEKLQKLNLIVHPEVKKHFDLWVKCHNEFTYIIKETAILFESGSDVFCDKIITVTAPLSIRIERVVERDGSTKEQVLERIASQLTDNERVEKSDFVIENLNIEQTKIKVETIVRKLSIK